MSSMCDTCHAGCCRAYNLFITVFDALQISRDLNLPLGEFVTLHAQNADGVKRMTDAHRPLRFSDPGYEDTFFYIALKRVESQLIAGTIKCYFLQEWRRAEPVLQRGDHPGAGIAGRCGIYASRPLVCRTYPSLMHPNGAVGFIGNPKSVDIAKTNPIYELCPEKWSTNSFGLETTQVVHTLVLVRYEVDFQNKLVEEWNANPRTLKEFFPYAVAAYANRFRLMPELVTTPEVVPQADPAPIPE